MQWQGKHIRQYVFLLVCIFRKYPNNQSSLKALTLVLANSYLRQELSVLRGCICQHGHLQLSSETSWQLELCTSVWSSADQSSPSIALKIGKTIKNSRYKLASFPGPTQLSIAISTEKWEWAWYLFSHEWHQDRKDVTKSLIARRCTGPRTAKRANIAGNLPHVSS